MGNSTVVQPGQRFERLTVLREGPRKTSPKVPHGRRTFWCECDCGQTKLVQLSNLTSGQVRSCGCLKRDVGLAKGVPVEVGERFGRGVVIDPQARIYRPSTPNGCPGARLLCDCGSLYEALNANLRNGHVKSCGCFYRDSRARVAALAGEAVATHGLRTHPLYSPWAAMIRRCSDERNKNYAGRGIAVCPEWQDVGTFIAWIEANLGHRPEGRFPSGRGLYSLDRINNDGNYEPGNVRWATASEQALNSRPSLNRRR